MGHNGTQPNGGNNKDNGQKTLYEQLLNLSAGEQIFINDMAEPFRVTAVRRNAEGGSTTMISLTREGTPSTIKLSNENHSIPTMNLPSTEVACEVAKVKPHSETIISNKRTYDFAEGKSTNPSPDGSPTDTYPQNRNIDHTPDDETAYIGHCPCGGSVIENEERALCVECGSWSWMPQWNAYHEHQQDSPGYSPHSQETDDDDESQATFDQYEKSDSNE